MLDEAFFLLCWQHVQLTVGSVALIVKGLTHYSDAEISIPWWMLPCACILLESYLTQEGNYRPMPMGMAAHPGPDSHVRQDSVLGEAALGGWRWTSRTCLSHPPMATGRHDRAPDGQEQTI